MKITFKSLLGTLAWSVVCIAISALAVLIIKLAVSHFLVAMLMVIIGFILFFGYQLNDEFPIFKNKS